MNFQRRIKISRRKIRCSAEKCQKVACRFREEGFTRVWFCAAHYEEKQDDRTTKTNNGPASGGPISV
jgi:hypothetical protein